jgi:hypothetical protein
LNEIDALQESLEDSMTLFDLMDWIKHEDGAVGVTVKESGYQVVTTEMEQNGAIVAQARQNSQKAVFEVARAAMLVLRIQGMDTISPETKKALRQEIQAAWDGLIADSIIVSDVNI